MKLLRGRIWDPQKHAALVQDSSRSFTEPLQAFPFFLFFQVFRATSSRVPFSSHALRLRQTASFLSHCTKSVRCVLGLLLSCYPTFTLSLPLWFSISIPLVLSYVSLSSRSSNSKGPASSSHLTSILRPQAHVQVRECRAGPGRPDLHPSSVTPVLATVTASQPLSRAQPALAGHRHSQSFTTSVPSTGLKPELRQGRTDVVNLYIRLSQL